MAVSPFVAALFLSDCFCSTADVYRIFDDSPPEMGEQLPADVPASGPSSPWRTRLRNQLTEPAIRVCPALGKLMHDLSAAIPDPLT